ncbi:MAG: cobalamin-dependent protein [Candidatus Polarisedimenticolaceae bacterium]|nr:cobalamin-dependent protein [Candidatus Polarisedimenticolaceae bacterium]
MKEPIKPYGDTLNDGMVQLSFTLPVENGPRAMKAAEVYVSQLNFNKISVVHAQKISDGFTYFMVYAEANPSIDYSTIEATEMEFEHMDFYTINALIKETLNRPLRVVGGTIGNDAHTVGIDAIMNMKGYNQDYGLERYPEIDADNLGSQIPCQEMVEYAVRHHADAILVSQTVTQKDSHILHLTELIDLLDKQGLRDQYLLLAGGAKISHELAIKLGYDAGFGPGTLPSQVASLLITKIIERAA